VLAPIESVSDGFKVPRLLRNQGIRHGSALAGQALYTAGGAITARGLHLSRTQTSVKRRKSSVVTKQQAKTAERMGGQKYNPSKYDYRPERSSSAQRWLKRRYNPKPTRVPKGTLHIRAGSTMMVAGRLLPVLAVGYLAYGLLPADRQEALTETPIGYGGSLRERVEAPIDFGVQAYTGAKIGYALGSNLLEAFSS
jgi:hypothetical protein